MLSIYSQCPCGSNKTFKDCCYCFIGIKSEKEAAQASVKWPFKEAFILKNWQQVGKSSLIICRTMPNGNLLIVGFLLDVWCLGVKDAYVGMNCSEDDLNFLYKGINESHPFGAEKISYEDARSIIFGALHYADVVGFMPHKDWHTAKYAIEPDRTFIDKFKFGYCGRPFYIQGPFDEKELDVESIKKRVIALGGGWNVHLEEDYDESKEPYV